MSKEAITQLVIALRAGDYKQTRYYLSDRNGHCCLGVACEVFNKIKPEILEIYRDEQSRYSTYDKSYKVLPEVVQEWLGFPNKFGGIPYGKLEAVSAFLHPKYPNLHEHIFTTLTELNDNGVSFDDIATVLEICYLNE